jgi:hypothetical protein
MPSEISRTTLLVAVGVCGAMLAGCLGVVFIVTHRDSQPVAAELANAEFAALRTRFAGQQPLLDMRLRSPVPQPAAAAVRVHEIHTMIFDTRGRQRLVKLNVPWWVTRMFATHERGFHYLGELTFFDDTEFDPEEIRLSRADIERHGPGLIVDYQHPGGGQFMVWVE